jgi:hypothetical protein
MLRQVVTAFHCALAVALGIDAVMVLQQSVVNLLWETAFYGSSSDHTGAVLLMSLVTLGLGAFQVVASAVYLSGRDGGGTAILIGSIALTVCVVEPMVRWAVIAIGMLILVESLMERIAELPDIE